MGSGRNGNGGIDSPVEVEVMVMENASIEQTWLLVIILHTLH